MLPYPLISLSPYPLTPLSEALHTSLQQSGQLSPEALQLLQDIGAFEISDTPSESLRATSTALNESPPSPPGALRHVQLIPHDEYTKYIPKMLSDLGLGAAARQEGGGDRKEELMGTSQRLREAGPSSDALQSDVCNDVLQSDGLQSAKSDPEEGNEVQSERHSQMSFENNGTETQQETNPLEAEEDKYEGAITSKMRSASEQEVEGGLTAYIHPHAEEEREVHAEAGPRLSAGNLASPARGDNDEAATFTHLAGPSAHEHIAKEAVVIGAAVGEAVEVSCGVVKDAATDEDIAMGELESEGMGTGEAIETDEDAATSEASMGEDLYASKDVESDMDDF